MRIIVYLKCHRMFPSNEECPFCLQEEALQEWLERVRSRDARPAAGEAADRDVQEAEQEIAQQAKHRRLDRLSWCLPASH